MRGRFSFTPEALRNLAVYGVTTGEVWAALHGGRRVIRHLGDDAVIVYAAIGRGRRIAVLLAEAGGQDNDWDVLSARELSEVEAKRLDEALRRGRR
ncbi:hypothetical protein ACFFWC_31665 [Plantactinospora siamensis]|uniref:DUF4258 domain-containing protein n=1 Tax=Plantactinospora siamensis TaxID=555372 RepID=A0ABV6NSF7_9ACTN